MSSTIEKKILVVDDEQYMRDSISLLLNRKLNGKVDYSIISCSNAREAMNKLQGDDFDIVLTDIRMPEVSGLELLDNIKTIKSELPVLLMTAYGDTDIAVEAVKQGAFDFITKPIHPDYLLHAVNRAIERSYLVKSREEYRHSLEKSVAEKTGELEISIKHAERFSYELIKRLTALAEFRDKDAGAHLSKTGTYAMIIARELEMLPEFVRNIKNAAPLHDIGKLVIADQIIFKSGPLTHDEYETMKTHTTQGARILSGSSNPVIQLAESIALNHHARWNGTGYPQLRGEGIPVEGRIVNICDQYDAVRSERVYKPEYSHEETVRIITQGDGRTMPDHFDPEVLKAFIRSAGKFNEVYKAYDKNPEDCSW